MTGTRWRKLLGWRYDSFVEWVLRRLHPHQHPSALEAYPTMLMPQAFPGWSEFFDGRFDRWYDFLAQTYAIDRRAW